MIEEGEKKAPLTPVLISFMAQEKKWGGPKKAFLDTQRVLEYVFSFPQLYFLMLQPVNFLLEAEERAASLWLTSSKQQTQIA